MPETNPTNSGEVRAPSGGARVREYAIAIVATAVATLLRWLFDPWLDNDLPFFFMYFAVLLTAWRGGLRPGLLTLILGLLAGIYFFTEPRNSWQVGGTSDLFGVARFAIVGIAVCLICESLHWAIRRAAAEHERLRALLASIGDAVIATDADGRITLMNVKAESLTGWASAEAIGQPLDAVLRIFNEQTGQAVSSPAAKALTEGVNVGFANHTVLISKDGVKRFIDDSAAPIHSKAGEIVGCVLVFRDVGERRKAEAELREREARFRIMADAAPVLIWMSGTDKLCTWFNKVWLDFVGRPMEDELGNGWAENVHPDDFERCLKTYVESFDARRPFSMEYRLRRHDGQYRWLLDNGVPRVTANGEFSGYIGSCVDITERKRLEEELSHHRDHLQKLVDQRTSELWAAYRRATASQRMAAVGTLAAGLAHDLKNIILPLGMRVDALLLSSEIGKEVRKELVVVTALLDHMRSLATNLSLFTRDPDHVGDEARTNVGRWCGQVSRLVDATVGAGVNVKWICPDGLPEAAIAPHRLTQAVQNLVHNGRDAINAKRSLQGEGTPGGSITVEALPSEDAAEVILQVTDDGCGMNEETRKRCLDPFFTTKDRPIVAGAGGGGSGLGLSLTHQIVERAGGTLEIESDLGVGTTIKIKLPAVPPQ